MAGTSSKRELTLAEQHASAAPAAATSVRERIREATAGGDPLASAVKVAAWLKTTTAETFRELAKEPEKFPSPDFEGFSKQFKAAYAQAIAERWLRSILTVRCPRCSEAMRHSRRGPMKSVFSPRSRN